MRVSLYVPFVLLCALLMSACTSEEEQAQQAQEKQEKREEAQKLAASYVGSGIEDEVVFYAGPRVRVECPYTVDVIVRLGCEAKSAAGLVKRVPGAVKRLRIKVARIGDGDSVNEYRVATKLLNKVRLEQILVKSLRTSLPNRSSWYIECPALVERKKGVRFVCKGDGVISRLGGNSFSGGYTVRARLGFTHDGGYPMLYGLKRVPKPSP